MFSLVVTLVILAFSMFFFVQGKIRSDIVALVALVLLMVFGVVSVEEALAGFSNSIVFCLISSRISILSFPKVKTPGRF